MDYNIASITWGHKYSGIGKKINNKVLLTVLKLKYVV